MARTAIGDYPFVWAFGYASDDETEPISNLYVEGIRKGTFYQAMPRKTWRIDQYWLANSANPGGFVEHGYEIPAFSWDTWLVDAVPFYLALGRVSVATAPDDYRINASPTGDVPRLVFHKEDNAGATDIYRNYRTAKIVKGELKILENMLAMRLTAVAEREISASVAQVSSFPPFRGSASPARPYRVLGNENITITWNTLNLGSYLQGLSTSWENPVGLHHLHDGNDYPTLFLDASARKFSPVVLDILQPPTGTVLSDLIGDVDGTTTSDLVITIPRRHANDYLKITFSNALLGEVEILPHTQDAEGVPMARLTFPHYTDLQVLERQVTDAGVSDPNDAATYEDVT